MGCLDEVDVYHADFPRVTISDWLGGRVFLSDGYREVVAEVASLGQREWRRDGVGGPGSGRVRAVSLSELLVALIN